MNSGNDPAGGGVFAVILKASLIALSKNCVTLGQWSDPLKLQAAQENKHG